MRLTSKCPHCSKVAEIVSEEDLGFGFLVKYKCGHSIVNDEKLVGDVNGYKFHSLKADKEAYEYQKTGTEFVETSGVNCLIADAMGLGKTIQSLLVLRNHFTDLTPCLIVVPPSTTYQWIREFKEWSTDSDLGICPVMGSDAPVLAGIFKTYLISMDLLGRKGMVEKLLTLGIKLIICDESHKFKDPSAKRSVALVKLIREGNIRHKIFLSGTPIKNRAGEYFTVLNLLAPEHFPSFRHFAAKWLTTDEKRIRPHLLEEFRKLTARWIIRREKNEVLTDLPEFTRNIIDVTIEDDWLKKSYNAQLDLMANFSLTSGRINATELLGWLAKLRRITGNAKVKPSIDYIEEFLENTEDDKIIVGVQHHDVRDAIFYALKGKGYGVVRFSGEDDQFAKERVKNDFINKPEIRVMVMSILSGGLGVDGLQKVCANILSLERQWTSTDEEQFESRIHRNGQTKPVIADYLVVHGTIDQFTSNKVETKRRIIGETVQGWDLSSDIGSLKELVQEALDNRL